MNDTQKESNHPADGSADGIDPAWLARLSEKTACIEVQQVHTAGELLQDFALLDRPTSRRRP